MSEKGYIAIPVDIRKDSGVAPGEEFMVLRNGRIRHPPLN